VLDYARLSGNIEVAKFAQLMLEFVEGKACANYVMGEIK
jgi:hypothetical protein